MELRMLESLIFLMVLIPIYWEIGQKKNRKFPPKYFRTFRKKIVWSEKKHRSVCFGYINASFLQSNYHIYCNHFISKNIYAIRRL